MPLVLMRSMFARVLLIVGGAVLCAAPYAAHAQDASATHFPLSVDGVYHEIETKYIFGFTDGSDIGAEGETAIESDTNAAFRKRHGSYNGLSNRRSNLKASRHNSSPMN